MFSFVCKKVDGNLTLSNEADCINYFSINEVPDNTVPRHKERIIDFFKNNEEVMLKGYYDPDTMGTKFNKG